MKNERPSPSNEWGMKQFEKNGLTVIDLFCGAGIGAVGMKRAGYEMVYAIDNQAYAVETYNRNIGNHAVVGDIRKLSGRELATADVVTGGFPCKSYSTIGNGKGIHDEKNGDLASHFVRLIGEIRPRAFLMENVGGLMTKPHRAVFDAIIQDLEAFGYRVTWSLIDCADYGVPQHRKRVFAVGIRADVGKTFEFPPVREDGYVTIREAIGDLPEPGEAVIPNHIGYGIRNDEAPFVHKIPPGGNWKKLEEEEQKVFLGKAFYSGGGRTGFLRKVSFDRSAWTLTSMMNGKNNAQIVDIADKTHGKQTGNRRFTVRECLRLQTVPDTFTFPEHITISKQYERCSGIPSLVAYKIGVALAELLDSDTLEQ